MSESYRPLAEFRDLPQNPKGHDIGAICTSLRIHGVLKPVTWNTVTGHTVGGNGTIEALRQLKAAGDPSPEGVRVDGRQWLIPDFAVTLPAEHEMAAAIALNHIQELAGDNDDLLTQALAKIANETPDLLPATGYDEDDIDRRIAKLANETQQAPPQDLYPLAIALTPEDHARWQAWKGECGKKRDTEALLALLER